MDAKCTQENVHGAIRTTFVGNNIVPNITHKKIKMEQLQHIAYSTATCIIPNQTVCISAVVMLEGKTKSLLLRCYSNAKKKIVNGQKDFGLLSLAYLEL